MKGNPRGFRRVGVGGKPLPQEGGAAPSEGDVEKDSWVHGLVCRGIHQTKPLSQALHWEKWHNSPAHLTPDANLRYLIW